MTICSLLLYEGASLNNKPDHNVEPEVYKLSNGEETTDRRKYLKYLKSLNTLHAPRYPPLFM